MKNAPLLARSLGNTEGKMVKNRNSGRSCRFSGRKNLYKGVRMRSWGSWVSEIRAPNHKARIWLGSYSTAEAAARAYDAALLVLKGSAATLNFPDSADLLRLPPYLPADKTMSPKSIQRLAAAAAAAADCPSVASSAVSPATDNSPASRILDRRLSTSPSPSSTTSSAISPVHEAPATTNPWVELGAFQSPHYVDETLEDISAWSAYDGHPPMEDYFQEDGDIRLWSFC